MARCTILTHVSVADQRPRAYLLKNTAGTCTYLHDPLDNLVYWHFDVFFDDAFNNHLHVDRNFLLKIIIRIC
jgi:hypothetical protein